MFKWAPNPRYIIEKLIGHEEAEIFAKWAWGENFRNMIFSDEAVNIWNEKHGDKMTLQGSGSPSEDIPKMVELWKSETSCQNKP